MSKPLQSTILGLAALWQLSFSLLLGLFALAYFRSLPAEEGL